MLLASKHLPAKTLEVLHYGGQNQRPGYAIIGIKLRTPRHRDSAYDKKKKKNCRRALYEIVVTRGVRQFSLSNENKI